MDPKKQFTRQAKLYAKSPLFSSGLSLKLLSSLLQEKKFSTLILLVLKKSSFNPLY